MKKIIVLLAATVLFVWTAAAQTKPDTITILHFNDSHSALDQIGPRYDNLRGTRGGIARAATWVRMYRFLEPNILLLHAGDISIGDLFYNTTFGAAELQLMLAMGLDAMTLGNHEFDLTPATFLQSVSAAFAEGSFPLLSANLVL
jgi:5'-nucleotidase/UDP-sugar diphosphatase